MSPFEEETEKTSIHGIYIRELSFDIKGDKDEIWIGRAGVSV